MMELVVVDEGVISFRNIGAVHYVMIGIIIIGAYIMVSLQAKDDTSQIGEFQKIAMSVVLSLVLIPLFILGYYFMELTLGVEGRGYYTTDLEVVSIGEYEGTVGDISGSPRSAVVMGIEGKELTFLIENSVSDKLTEGDEVTLRTEERKLYKNTKLEEPIEEIVVPTLEVGRNYDYGIVIDEEYYKLR